MYKEVHANIRKNPIAKKDPLAIGYFSGKKRAAPRKAAVAVRHFYDYRLTIHSKVLYLSTSYFFIV